MQFISTAYEQALHYSHSPVAYVDAVTAQVTARLRIEEGRWVQNFDDATRSSLDLRMTDPLGRAAVDLRDTFDTKNTKLVLRSGIRFPDGSEELVECGTYYPQELEVDADQNLGPMIVTQAFDQSFRAQHNLTSPVSISPGMALHEATTLIVTKSRPHAEFRLGRSPFVTPMLLIREDTDPWSEALKFNMAAGFDLYVERDDVFVSTARVIDVTTAAPVWHYDTTRASSDAKNLRRVDRHDNYPNIVVVIGDHPSTPGVVGMARDENPGSATYWEKEPTTLTVHTDRVTTIPQATEMARYILSKKLGPQDEVTFDAVPNPALDVGDVIMVTDVKSGLDHTKLVVAEIDRSLPPTRFMAVTARRSIQVDGVGLERQVA